MKDDLTFRAATEADMPFLLELRRKTMSEHLRLSGIEPSESERPGFRIVGENEQAYDMEFGAW